MAPLRTKHLAFVLASPILSVGLLAGIVAEQRGHLTSEAVEPYHFRAAAAINQVPYIIGTWTGEDKKVPLAAQKLLRPNAILSRSYVDSAPSVSHVPKAASLL